MILTSRKSRKGEKNMRKLQEVKMSDHEFSIWLKERGWEGEVKKEVDDRFGISAFISKNGELLCKVIYNNQLCTHRIFI